MRIQLPRVIVLIALFAVPAFTQTQPTRIRGVIESFGGQTLLVKTADGQTTFITVPPDLAIRANEKATLADIMPGDFVASAASKGPDGKVHAEELRIFPEAMRGAGEGHRPMAPLPGQAGSSNERTMTNGTVAAPDPEARTMTNGTVSATGASGSRSITVKYKEGETVIVIDPETPITRIVIADRALLKRGTGVTIVATQGDGALVATSITAEKDSVKP